MFLWVNINKAEQTEKQSTITLLLTLRMAWKNSYIWRLCFLELLLRHSKTTAPFMNNTFYVNQNILWIQEMESKSRYHIKSISQYNLSPVKVSLMTISCTAAPWHSLEVWTPCSSSHNLPGPHPLPNATTHATTAPFTPAPNLAFPFVGL